MKKYILALVILFNTSNVLAQSLGDVYCGSSEVVMKASIQYRRQNMPIDTVLDMTDSYRDNRRLYYFLREYAIPEIYKNPDNVEKMLNNGEMRKKCTNYVNGF